MSKQLNTVQPGETKEKPLKEIKENPYDMTFNWDKEDRWCGVDISYGYVPLSEPKNAKGVCPNKGFYWFYPSPNPNAPVLVTVIGGPGMCVVSKAFGRYNPLDVSRKDKKLFRNENSIIDRFQLLYIECPIGIIFILFFS